MSKKAAKARSDDVVFCKIRSVCGPEWVVHPIGVEDGGYGVGLNKVEKVGNVILITKGRSVIGRVFRHEKCGEVCYTRHACIDPPPPLRKLALLQILAIMDHFDVVVADLEKHLHGGGA